MNVDSMLPVGHTLIETADGSYTFFSEAFQEACHSTSGATAETLLHYIEGCQIKNKIQEHSPLVILEVGFGLGVGFLTTLSELPKDRHWHFISVELDRNLLEWFRLKNSDHWFLKNLTWSHHILEAKSEFVTLTILCGNARETLPHYMEKSHLQWHAIYQDAFSPKKNPILWTREWFSFLKTHAASDCILSTYSASSSIRKSLYEAGFGLKKGAKFGVKKTSTRAHLDSETDPEILFQLERSPVDALRDHTT